MCLSKKQTKKKWTLTASVVLTFALMPAEASSPLLSLEEQSSRHSSRCGEKAMTQIEGTDGESSEVEYGTCAAGSPNCCGGAPDAVCASGGGGRFQWL